MSASPTSAVASTKRPLEDPSSPSGPTDQPDAKRPALDKVVKGDDEESKLPQEAESTATEATKAEAAPLPAAAATAGENGVKDEQGDLVVPDAPNANGKGTAAQILETQPIQSTASQNDRASSQPPSQHTTQDESGWIHIRAVISSAEAATCIGKGGENVSQIRRLSGAKCTVSDYSRGAVERILTVSGMQDAVAKAFGLIIRTLNNEPLEAPSTAQSKTYPLRLLIPHLLIGSIIGKSGVRIREIQEASGARLNASDSCLPLSTERTLIILGVADAVHIATYYVAVTLVEQLTERFGGPAASAYATRSGGPAGVVPGGMQVVPYIPQPAGGQYGHPDTFKRHQPQGTRAVSTGGYGVPYVHGQPGQPQMPQQALHYGASSRPGYTGAGPHQPSPYGAPQQSQVHGAPSSQPVGGVVPGAPVTQQIFIPNDMVGAIIGKGGAKINEIRHLSGSVIKINEPQDNSNERLVTITGTPECNQMALYMLYSRLVKSDIPHLQQFIIPGHILSLTGATAFFQIHPSSSQLSCASTLPTQPSAQPTPPPQTDCRHAPPYPAVQPIPVKTKWGGCGGFTVAAGARQGGRALGKGRMASSTVGVVGSWEIGRDGVRVVCSGIGVEEGEMIGVILAEGTEEMVSRHLFGG
ncbi:hypothetical protein ACO22_00734 [Paracoccidioides brasiliensis]|uniref:K Homology domain-containing protein n=1 Tax=Paracoccidioides brasiliensis TaxID=121759 RepID=A0A1D2JNT0_PARBR|nr:hypothetical protein ACO22_00734 [Paracoccidioides brasiliensis]